MQEVYDGSTDPQYAGLADSYYLAAMAYMEDVIRPKDLKTLQCLVLVAQYSLLTPTRTAIYYIIGLATRLCQQLGLTEEKTITQGVSLGMVNPLQLDMRRRLSWIILSMDFGLAWAGQMPLQLARIMLMSDSLSQSTTSISPLKAYCRDQSQRRKLLLFTFLG
jgi:hypothetical protein